MKILPYSPPPAIQPLPSSRQPQPLAPRPPSIGQTGWDAGGEAALRARLLTTLGASAPSTLRTEVLGDGRANCLEKAMGLAQPQDAIVLMNDRVDGVGHALVQKPDGSVVDPNYPQVRYETLGQWMAMNPRYTNPTTIPASQVQQVLSIPPGLEREARINELGLSGIASRPVADDPPGFVKANVGINLRSGPSTDRSIVEPWPAGTEFRVLGRRTVGNEQWLRVVAPDGRRGWIVESLTTPSDGVRTGSPYVLPAESGHPERTGRPESAVAWAQSWVGAGTGNADNCLGFVNNAFGIHALPARSREMSNPANFVTGAETQTANPEASGFTDSAYAAYLALDESGKMHDVPSDLNQMPDGAILFFAPTDKNDGNGHVCILQRNEDGELYVVTSGWGETSPDNQVQYIPLQDMIDTTGALIGYTTVDDAFSAETYPREE